MSVTPEQIVEMLPKGMIKNKVEFERLLKDQYGKLDVGVARYESRLGAVVWDTSPTAPDGSELRMCSYVITTKPCITGLTAFSTPKECAVFFEQAQGVISTIKVKEDDKMLTSWTDKLKNLLGVD